MNDNNSPDYPIFIRKRNGCLLIQCILAIVLFFLLIKVVPVFENIFKDFGARLPALTMLQIDLSGLFRRPLGVIIIPSAFGFQVCMTLFFSQYLFQAMGLRAARLYFFISTLLIIIFIMLLILSMFLPIFNLQEMVSQ